MRKQIKFLAVVFSVLLLFSCKDKGGYSKIKNKKYQSASNVHKIVVNEFLDGGNYAYLHVDEAGNNYWMAIPRMEVNIGETYYYSGGMLMREFESKQLKRTFDLITFVDGIRLTEKTVVKKENPHLNSTKENVEVQKIEIPANGTSLSDLFSKKELYFNKSIIVRGKVTKVNKNIMDRNWVHISDGTKFDGKASLTVTTLEQVKVGDIVTFKGIVILDKNFGQGYVYPILLEEGNLVK